MFMGPTVDSRIKTSGVKISLLQTESEVKAVEQSSSVE